MKTLREVAEALCPIRLGEDYDKTIYNMIDKACHNEWIDGFIAGLAIVGAMAVDAEKEGRFIPAQEILKGIQKSKTDN